MIMLLIGGCEVQGKPIPRLVPKATSVPTATPIPVVNIDSKEERRQEPTGRQAVWMWRVLQFKRFQDMPTGREQTLYRFVDRVVANELQTVLNQTPDEDRNNISREAEQLVTSIPSGRI